MALIDDIASIILSSKKGSELPVKVSLDGTEWLLFYNDVTQRVERALLDGVELKSNKAVDFAVIDDIKYPTVKAVNDELESQKGTTIATLDGGGKLTANQLPDLAITDVITAVETSIADFATNSGSYTFEQGDVIIITNGGDTTHYLYKGGVKTDVNEYSEINATQITISQVTDLQNQLDLKADLTNSSQDIIANNFIGKWNSNTEFDFLKYYPEYTNKVTESENFSLYPVVGGNITLNSGISAPDGTNNAYSYRIDVSGSFLYDGGYYTSTLSSVTTRSLFVKNVNATSFRMFVRTATSVADVIFNFSGTSIINYTLTQGISASFEDYGNDWYRISVTYTEDSTTAQYLRFLPNTSGEVYIFGNQLNNNNLVLPYLKTTGTSKTSEEGVNTSWRTVQAEKFVKNNGTSDDVLLGDGSTTPLSSIGGTLPTGFYEDLTTFTPTLVDNGGGATYSYTLGNCNYDRVGNRVNYVLSFLSINTTGTPTGQLRVTGLPYDYSTGYQFYSVLNFRGSDVSTADLEQIDVRVDGVTYMYFRTYVGGSSLNAVTFTNGNLTISGSYTVNQYTP